MADFAANRSKDLEARTRQIEDQIVEISADLATLSSSSATNGTGGGTATSPGGGGGGGGGGGALAGDVIGLPGSNEVVAIHHSDVDTPVAGDDQQFAQYDHSSGTIRWVAIPATVYAYRTITANDTATTADGFIFVDATAGAVTLTLPTAASMAGRILVVKKIDTSVINTVTVDGSGAETIDNDLTAIMTIPYTSISLISNGTAWYIW